ncbi:SGNH/GDSL hydrolase family protein [Corynebacterium pyruviciproducens]
MGFKRQIRFKEWGVELETTKTPTDDYMRGTDGSVKQEPYLLRTDTEGFILTGNEFHNYGGMRKVVLLGDSFVESLFCEEKQRFASILEAKFHSDGSNLQVWNAGYSGATLLHIFDLFVNKIVPLLQYVEKVVVFTGSSDQRTLGRARNYWTRDRTHSPIIDPRNFRHETESKQTTEHLERLLGAFIDFARTYDTEICVVLTPFRFARFGEDEFLDRVHSNSEKHQAALNQLRLINSAAKSVCEAKGISIIDGQSYLEKDPRLFYDSVHLNPVGQSKFAEFLFSELKRILS